MLTKRLPKKTIPLTGSSEGPVLPPAVTPLGSPLPAGLPGQHGILCPRRPQPSSPAAATHPTGVQDGAEPFLSASLPRHPACAPAPRLRGGARPPAPTSSSPAQGRRLTYRYRPPSAPPPPLLTKWRRPQTGGAGPAAGGSREPPSPPQSAPGTGEPRAGDSRLHGKEWPGHAARHRRGSPAAGRAEPRRNEALGAARCLTRGETRGRGGQRGRAPGSRGAARPMAAVPA